MLSTATTATAPFVSTYDRSGRTSSLFRSEPVQRIASITEQSSTTPENYKDQVTLSESAVEKSRQNNKPDNEAKAPVDANSADQQKEAAGKTQTGTLALTPEEQKVVVELQQRDREVKAHEQAHLANAGQYARGGATYSYQQGPDGRRYAIGGEVPIDISPEKTPEQTIMKMQTVKRAAMAPAEPSAADRSIAAAAAALEAQARQEAQAAQMKPAVEPSGPGEQPPESDAPSQQNEPATSNSARRTQPLNTVA
jgi:hypothetical protein